jgi:heme/copper-type cytochrome/quinol oxidase subunit 2
MKPARTFVVLLIGLACSFAAIIFVPRIYAHLAARPALRVRAVAHQWWWEFDYPALGIKTSNALYLPSSTNVRLELVSADVIHSFWITGMKTPLDIVPGGVSAINLLVKSPGVLYGNCDSGCGCGSVCMRFRVLASNPADFQRWAALEHSSRAQFTPPPATDTPACALDTGHDGHGRHSSPTTHLQQLLDGRSSPTG